MSKPVLINDWHPVAETAALTPGKVLAAKLMGHELAIWRSADGTVRIWEDRCPHRGARFSIGRIENDGVTCAYHGWRFAADGQCVHLPAQPDFKPSANMKARAYHARERYGLVWACIGDPASGQTHDLLPFPEYDDANLRKVLCGPYDVACSGPRIVENFLDMAHFGFVHSGILGDTDHTAMRNYKVSEFDDGAGNKGVLATQCFAWQQQTNSLSHGGSDVEYTYRVVRPLTAILTKLPEKQADFREAISLHIQPVTEESSRAWIILAMTNFVQTDDELRGFQDRIFLQDQPIVENQVPLKLPLARDAEIHMGWDRMSVAYRRYLVERGMDYGVIHQSMTA